MTEIYLHIVARMADYMATHPYQSWRRGLLHDGLSLQGPQFEPVCQESEACIDATRKGLQGHAFSPQQGVCRCSGYSNGGPLLPNVEVRDDLTTARQQPLRSVSI